MPNDTIPDRLQTREQMLRGLSKGQIIPEWAMEQAAALRSAVVWQSNASNEVIARALVEAERKGMERAAQHMDQRAREILSSGSVTAIGMSRIYEDESAAIRKLMESSDEA